MKDEKPLRRKIVPGGKPDKTVEPIKIRRRGDAAKAEKLKVEVSKDVNK